MERKPSSVILVADGGYHGYAYDDSERLFCTVSSKFLYLIAWRVTTNFRSKPLEQIEHRFLAALNEGLTGELSGAPGFGGDMVEARIRRENRCLRVY
jgi:hypothetical protein